MEENMEEKVSKFISEISDNTAKYIRNNLIEINVIENSDGSTEICIQPWEPASNYMLNSQEFNDLKTKIKQLEETIAQLRTDLLFLKYKPHKI